jgi:hypothetical protein
MIRFPSEAFAGAVIAREALQRHAGFLQDCVRAQVQDCARGPWTASPAAHDDAAGDRPETV